MHYVQRKQRIERLDLKMVRTVFPLSALLRHHIRNADHFVVYFMLREGSAPILVRISVSLRVAVPARDAARPTRTREKLPAYPPVLPAGTGTR